MEIDPSKGEELSIEEEVLKKLLNEWRHLDKTFIREDQKKLYKDTFQQYKAKQGQRQVEIAEQLGLHHVKPEEYQNIAKGGKKRGVRNLQETIQIMGEMLANMVRVVPLSMVYQQLKKVSQ